MLWECEGWFSLGITYADNLVLCGESVEKVMGNDKDWKEALKGKGLGINVRKTYIIYDERDH